MEVIIACKWSFPQPAVYIRLQAAQVKSRTFSNSWLLFICYLLIPCSVFWGKLSVCIAVGDDKKDDQVDDQIGEKVDAKNDKLEEELVDE